MCLISGCHIRNGIISIFFSLQSGDSSAGIENATAFPFPRYIFINGSVFVPQYFSPITRRAMVHSNLALQGIPGAGEPMFIQSIGVDWAYILQKSPFPSLPTSIWFIFSVNANVPAASEITIHGLINMQTADNAQLPCTGGPDASTFPTRCVWNQSQGTLTMVSGKGGLEKGRRYTVNFTLINPNETFIHQQPFSISGRFVVRAILEVPMKAFYDVQVPSGSLLGFGNISGLSPSTPGAVVTPWQCRNMSKGSGVVQALHVCMTLSGLSASVTGCIATCNTSVVPAVWTPDHLRCCALKCLDNCWERRLEFENGDSDRSGQWIVAFRRRLDVSWSKRSWSYDANDASNTSTFFLQDESEHVFGVSIFASLVRDCSFPAAPWLCQPASAAAPGSLLNGTISAMLDPFTGRAVFTDLAIVGSVCDAKYQLAFFANNFSVDIIAPGFSAGSLVWPTLLATRSWPVVLKDVGC